MLVNWDKKEWTFIEANDESDDVVFMTAIYFYVLCNNGSDSVKDEKHYFFKIICYENIRDTLFHIIILNKNVDVSNNLKKKKTCQFLNLF